MSTITKDLGVVTAYGYYKAGGGTMTEAEFIQFMVDFGTASKTAVDAASAALESERAARASEETATSKASEAGDSASTASTKAGEAAQSASDADTAKTDAVNAKTAAETAQGKAEDAQAAAEAVAESIPSDYSQLSEDVSDLKEDLQDETARAQAEEARIEALYTGDIQQTVVDWLDDHPEATTTVQDWSLTPNKFVKGSLGFVTPQMFGAVADGVTDDAQAIKDAVDFSMANGCAVYIPSGIYAVSPRVITIDFAGNDSCIIYGDGKASCIKRLDNSLTAKFDRLIVVNNTGATADSDQLIIKDLYFDSNRRNQENATTDATYEAAHEIAVMLDNSNGYALDTALFENLHFYDGVADHLSFTASAKVNVKHVLINGFFASGRDAGSARNDIDFPGYPIGDIFISNVSCQDIHAEFNTVPSQSIEIHLSQINCRHFTVGGGNLIVFATGMKTNGAFIAHRVIKGYFTNCSFYIRANSYIANPTDVSTIVFSDCDFTFAANGDASRFLNIEQYLDITFSGCTFDFDGESVTGYPIKGAYFRNSTKQRKMKLLGCTISSKFSQGMYLYSCGDVIIENMVFTNSIPFFLQGTEGKLDVWLHNVLVDSESSYTLRGGNASANEVTVHGDITCYSANAKISGNGTFQDNVIYDWTRTIKSSDLPTASVIKEMFRLGTGQVRFCPKGTEIVYDGANAQAMPIKWAVCNQWYTTSSVIDLNDYIITEGSGVGATADRPTCYLQKGFEYFDTDLGKMIIWNGTTWVNVDGTALA